MQNRISSLFKIKYPIVQAGMVWASGWRLASAVSNAGGLGIIGAGSMYPEVLKEHIQKCQKATKKPFGVNIPLLYPEMDKLMEIVVSMGVKIVFTSAGNPALWTAYLKENGITVVHVVSSLKFALKAEAAGVDAIVVEGFEAGGHNGREETTTLVLVPTVKEKIQIPLIAAGGIATGKAMLATMILGADGVQIGSRFVASHEASSHINFKNQVVTAGEGDTELTLKELTPVRLLKNKFYEQVRTAYAEGFTKEDLKKLLGRARAKKGMFEGDMDEGELEIGQVAALIHDIKPASEIVSDLMEEFYKASDKLPAI
ncbi:NAD(P)H-dependent flavin oxidoreductase [Eudoraea chungangensis]|uniref:NAD(P)H-dependent flavin oxidoreductase n=1 Tax=Eudoraea chungangensis TaxID=1481905 RepID=UPI0023EAA591|nr:nitronate monooxygenase [Eudoraea chungangensis]